MRVTFKRFHLVRLIEILKMYNSTFHYDETSDIPSTHLNRNNTANPLTRYLAFRSRVQNPHVARLFQFGLQSDHLLHIQHGVPGGV